MTTANVMLGPGAEFDAVRRMLAIWGGRAAGIGDDAAIARLPRGDAVLVSTDVAIEHQHFERAWLTPAEIGYRAVTAALSDLAAMAAWPVGVLTSLVVPRAWRNDLDELARGIGDAVACAETLILGGNVSDGDVLSLTSTVIGRAFAPLARSGAAPGDDVYVTGRLGAPSDALRRWRAGEDAGDSRSRFARPAARLAEARWLAERGASACIDISDGLVADARHLAAASRAAIALDAARVPCVEGVATARASASGEEYELIVTMRGAVDVAEFERRFAVPLTCIGVVRTGDGVTVDGADGPAAAGYDHFSP